MSASPPSRRQGGLFDWPAWRFLAAYYAPHVWRLAAFAMLTALQSLLIVPLLYLVRLAFDRAMPQGDVALLVVAGAGMLASRIANSVVGFALRAAAVRTIVGVLMVMRRDLIARLYALSRQFYGTADCDRLHARIVQDTARVDEMSSALVSGILPALCSAALLCAVLAYLKWWLLLLTAAVAPLVWIANRFTGRNVKADVHQFQRAFESFSKGVQFVIRQMDLTRVRAFEEGELERQHGHLDELRRSGERMALSFAMHGHIQKNIAGLAGLVIMVGGGAAVASRTMSMGEFISFYVAAGLLNGHVDSLLGGIPALIVGNQSLAKLRQIMSEGPPEPYSGERLVLPRRGLALRGISFAYDGREVLRNVSLEIPLGSTVAIVGPNGAGKSTILHLIMGFLRPRSGAAYADEVAYDELDIRALRRSIGVVMQHPGLFAGTVIENIAYGSDATREEVIEAAKRAQAHDFIAALAAGYDTPIGEGGTLLSGGQAQLLAVARALLGRPKLLVLDEPTNHLDRETIGRLMQALKSPADRPGILLISHDDEVIRDADTVYRLDRGALARREPASEVA